MWISKNGDTPIAGWIVDFMENPISMITRGSPMSENQHISVMFHKNRIQMHPEGDDPFSGAVPSGLSSSSSTSLQVAVRRTCRKSIGKTSKAVVLSWP